MVQSAVFLNRPGKSIWTPVTKVSSLGFLIDLSRYEITVPDEKIESLTQQLMEADTKEVCEKES